MKKPSFMIAAYIGDFGIFHPYIFDMDRIDDMHIVDDDELLLPYLYIPVTNSSCKFAEIYHPQELSNKFVFNSKLIDLPRNDIYTFFYALKKLLTNAMNEYNLASLL